MTINELANDKRYTLHHRATAKGYVSRKTQGYVKEYSGRFGKGYAVFEPRFDTTRFVYITYYVEK